LQPPLDSYRHCETILDLSGRRSNPIIVVIPAKAGIHSYDCHCEERSNVAISIININQSLRLPRLSDFVLNGSQ
jgi:hypothetical protein